MLPQLRHKIFGVHKKPAAHKQNESHCSPYLSWSRFKLILNYETNKIFQITFGSWT